MVELDVKITSGDLYDFLLRHSYNSVSGLLGAVIGALGVDCGNFQTVLDLSDPWEW